MKGAAPLVLEAIFIFVLLAMGVVLLLAYLLGADLIEIIQDFLASMLNPPPPRMSPDAERYFELKNRSCATLSSDFLIVLADTTDGALAGLRNSTPEDAVAAQAILSGYRFNQTLRVYSKGDWMKQVVTDADGERTIIWKEGRIYECARTCTMRLMEEEESDAYYAILDDLRTSCAYFGNTKMPASVDVDRLLQIEHKGALDRGSFRCQDFYIHGNATYAQSLRSSPKLTLNEDQKAILWLLSHLSGPVEECLDEATGIIVLRNLSIDLTRSYDFSYEQGGYMRVNQKTELLYFSDNVPESFFGLPD